MRVFVAAVVFLGSAFAAADVPRDPPPQRPEVQRPAPSPEKPTQPSGKACGMGAGAALFAIGVLGAWRLSKARSVTPEARAIA